MLKISPLILAIPFLLIGCGAKGPEGKWVGKITIDTGQMSAPQKAQAEMMKAMLEKGSLEVELKADKTGSLKTSGLGQDQSATAKWTMENKVITFTPSQGQALTMKLSEDGKTLTADLPNATKGAALTFKRAESK